MYREILQVGSYMHTYVVCIKFLGCYICKSGLNFVVSRPGLLPCHTVILSTYICIINYYAQVL